MDLTVILDSFSVFSDSIKEFDINYVDELKLPDFGAFRWYSQSCYIDSILMIILISDTNYWLDAIMNADTENIDYPITVCSSDSKVNDINNFSTMIKSDILNIRKQLIYGKDIYCTNLRKELGKCFTDMIHDNRLGQYEVTNIYKNLAELFPDFNFEVVEKIEVEIDGIMTSHENKVMTSHVEIFSNDLENIFNNQTSEIVVLSNELKLYDDLTVLGYSEYIPGFEYRLLAVVIHQGGNHFLSLFRHNDSWYYYNDYHIEHGVRHPVIDINKLDYLPEYAFAKSGQYTPIMLFYQHY